SAYNFQIDVRPLTEPRLITFAVTTKDIESAAAAARKAGYPVFGPRSGSRQTLSGKMLRWKSLGVLAKLASGGIDPMPFFIQWEPGVTHPSQTEPAGCELDALEFRHPDPSSLSAAFKAFGIDAKVSQAGAARIVATLKTPRGRVELS